MKWIFLYQLQLPPETLTRGLPPPDPCSRCPQLSLLTPPPKKKEKIRGYTTATDSCFCFLGSGSHLNSIHMVHTKQAEAAAIDANTLTCNREYLQDAGKDVQVLCSIGPLPPYPIVVNNRLESEYNSYLHLL